MSLPSSEPLDEIVWRSPGLYHQFFGGSLTPMTALLYFRESPFFDRLSNNGSLWAQAQYNPALQALLHSRDALETRLRSMTGLEFVIAMEAPESGFYAIRRQIRKGRRLPKFDLGERPDRWGVGAGGAGGAGGGDGKVEDVRVDGVFFVVGENIYPAPRVGQVLASRQLAVVVHLRNALRKAGELAKWTPGRGHHFMPQSSASASAAGRVGGGGTAAAGDTGLGVGMGGTLSQATTQPPSQIPTPSHSGSTTTTTTTTTTNPSSQHAPPSQPSQTSTTLTTSTTTTTTSSSTRPPIPSEQSEINAMRASVILSLKHAADYLDAPPAAPPAALPGTSSSSFSTRPAGEGGGGSKLGGGGGGGGGGAGVGGTAGGGAAGGMSVPVPVVVGAGGRPQGPVVMGLGMGMGMGMGMQGGAGQGQGQGGGGQAGGQLGQGGQVVPKMKRRKSKAAGIIPT